MTHPIDRFLSDHYRREDVAAITRHLTAAGTFRFPTLASGLFSAAAVEAKELEYTGYQNVWVRDNIHIAHHFHVLGEHGKAARAVAAITRFLHTQRHKVDDIVAGRADPGNVMLRPHVRFDGDKLAEVPERWAHAQNDAIGYWMWLTPMLAQAGHLPLSADDFDLLAAFVRYFDAIRFWEDEDSGHWEEARKVEASSVGVATAGLAAVRDHCAAMLRGTATAAAAKSPIEETLALAAALADRGRAALDAILPFECVQEAPGRRRRCDAALLFLVYPVGIVSDAMAKTIVTDVVTHLAGPYGVRRYLGDSYWCADYKTLLDAGNRTVDVSDDMSARDRLLQPGGEAQWCLFDPIISVTHGLRYRRTGDPASLQLQHRHLNRSLSQLTGAGTSFPPLRCPESYYCEHGRYVPNDITPLLWTQANLRLALHHMEQSLGGSAPVGARATRTPAAGTTGASTA
jgi:phosphorylase kinase alpha/beta subunit